MSYYKLYHPYPFLYHFRDPQGTCFSIIKGSKKAIVVDCGYGIGNPRKEVEKYIDTPYIVINTHGHMDHTGGNYLFDEVYLPKIDFPLCKLHNNKERRMQNVLGAKSLGLIDDTFDTESYINKGCGNIKELPLGTLIDLGDLHVEVIPMEGHTKGSIGLLVKEKEFLLSGDAAIHMIWLFLAESTDRKTYINMLKRVKKLPFKEFITGHIMQTFDKKLFDYYIEVAEKATPTNSSKVTFKNFERENTYQYQENIEGMNIGICYQEPKED